MTITRLVEGLPAEERLAVRKLCKIRGETFEDFARYAIWKASQAIELGAEDFEALAVESRTRDGTVTVRKTPDGGAYVEFTGEAASRIQRVAKRMRGTPSAAIEEFAHQLVRRS